jgi:hypothetical protein
MMRHGATRDRLRRELDVLCFEMKAAGLTDCYFCYERKFVQFVLKTTLLPIFGCWVCVWVLPSSAPRVMKPRSRIGFTSLHQYPVFMSNLFFVVPCCPLPAFVPVLRAIEGRPYLYRHGGFEHVYQSLGSATELHRYRECYLCRLSGRGYRRCCSGHKGQIYPGESCTSLCRIISFFLLNPFPPIPREQSSTGQ